MSNKEEGSERSEQQWEPKYACLVKHLFKEVDLSRDLPYLSEKRESVKVQRKQSSSCEQKAVKRSCTCKKSQCLKQYCECFSIGQECSIDCKCMNCLNNFQNRKTRTEAMEMILHRDPKAFSGKSIEESTMRCQSRGCSCKKSGCTKKYCECFQNGQGCSWSCKCEGCSNVKQAGERISSFRGIDLWQSQGLIDEIEACIEPGITKKMREA